MNFKFGRPRSSRGVAAPSGGSSDERVESRLRTVLMALFLLAAGPALFALYFHHYFAGLVQPDAMDYAQIGRNLAAGRGFSTDILRPLALTHGSDPLRQPDVTHGPLYPLILALAFGALGAKDTVVVGVSGLFYILTIPAVYLLGTRVFNQTVGVVAALGFAFNTAVLQLALSGTPTTLLIFLTTILMITLYGIFDRAGREGPWLVRPLVIAGLLAGGLYLTDLQFFFVVPVAAVAVTVLARANRWRALAAFGLATCALVLPWMVRNFVLTGNPIFGLKGMEFWMGTPLYPGYSAYRMMPDELVPSLSLFQAVLRKMFDNLLQLLPGLVSNLAGPLLVFLIPSVLFRFQKPHVNQLRGVMLLLVLSVAVTLIVFGVNLSLISAFLPGLLVFSVAFLIHLSGQAQLPQRTLIALSALACATMLCPVLGELTRSITPQPLPQVANAKSLAKQSAPRDVCLSDEPWVVAWYADRPSLWIPSQTNKIRAVGHRLGGVRWLLLTRNAGALSPEWASVYSAFAQWSVAYQQSQAAGTPAPPFFQITGKQTPLVEALNGFGPVAPDTTGKQWAELPSGPPAAIIAAVRKTSGSAAAEVGSGTEKRALVGEATTITRR